MAAPGSPLLVPGLLAELHGLAPGQLQMDYPPKVLQGPLRSHTEEGLGM